MRITPRADELKHVGETIDKEYESVDKAARAVMKAVSEALDLRDWWTVVAPNATERGNPILLGIYATEKEAEKARDKLLSTTAFDGLFIWPIMSMAPVFGTMENIPSTGDCECGHRKTFHMADGTSKGRCGLTDCDCEKFKEGKFEIPSFPTCVSCRQPVLT